MKKLFCSTLALCAALSLILTGCGSSGSGENGEVVVYNWGEYIDPETITMFEEETGIKVVYDEFETNEVMYPKVEAGATAYDVICPSDYMIQKMIDNDLLAEINFDNIPNAKNIGQQYFEQSKEFDPDNKYSVPYCFGTVGILYNKTMVDEPVDSWSILWDDKYADNILMQDSVRDAFMVALKLNGYSMNSLDENELEAAKNSLIEQKPLVQAYVIDQVRDKMIGNEAAIGVIYSGEAIYTQRENPDLEYVIPKEGSNVWIDSWVIPANAKNKENAEALVKNGVKYIIETSNMGCTPEAVEVFREAKVPFAPSKAANAGGVAVSGLEMSQNSAHLSWSSEEVDKKLHDIMVSIHDACVREGREKDGSINYIKGANIAGFKKVADAMCAQGY